MRSYLYIILFALIFTSCSNDDDVTTFSPKSIKFIHSNGAIIEEGDCIDPSGEYAIVIEVNAVGNGPNIPTKVEFTVNGAVYSTTFTNRVSKSIPIDIKEGGNIAELVKTGISSSIYVTIQDDFVLVY